MASHGGRSSPLRHLTRDPLAQSRLVRTQWHQSHRSAAYTLPKAQSWLPPDPTWAIQCIYCIIQCIHSVSDSSPDTLRYNTYCIHCISTRYSGYGLYQPLDQIQWIHIAHVGCRWFNGSIDVGRGRLPSNALKKASCVSKTDASCSETGR